MADLFGGHPDRLADGVGFEPTERLHVRRFSRPLPSTTRPPVQVVAASTATMATAAKLMRQ